MSSVYIPLALIATFAAVMLAGIAIEITVSERRRTVEVFQNQVGHLAANLRSEDLSRSFLERVLLPVARGLGSAAKRLTPLDMRKRIDGKLVLAGNPAGWDAEKVAAIKIVAAV